MESSIAEGFLGEFDDSRYPTEFLERYEAMECFSSGQYGETLLVREKAGGRLLVAKCYENGHCLFESAEPEEFRALSHPGLPAFAGEMRCPSMRCILREYVEGETLWELKRENPFTQETVRSIGMELCEILKYLHSQVPPVIHRDIKPQNVVIRADGSPVLIDLGISRLYVEGARSDTVFCGTQEFAPPEQYGFQQTDCRSDIYSLGILFSWMLTGKPEAILEPKTPLERVAAKCTSFSPEKRFHDAAALKRALRDSKPVVVKRKKIALGAGTLFLMAAFVLFGLHLKTDGAAGAAPPPESGTTASSVAQISENGFTEPLIEEAVRLMLGKDADDPISSEELASVSELYITHDTACADIDKFYNVHKELCEKDFEARGPITSLRDLGLLPNLRILCMASEQITDISPLQSLANLNQVELRFNSVADISPLSGLKNLSMVGLNSNPVADISPLSCCDELRVLDLCDAGDYDGSAIALLGDLDFLDISNSTDSYLYLGGKSVGELKISKTALTDLSSLRDVRGIRRLEICGTRLSDLSELENHPEITYLRLCDIPATDFSVLLKLPNLETVSVSASAKEHIEPVAAQGAFKVSYE